MSSLSDGISKELPVDGNEKLDRHNNTRIRQENMDASSDETPTEMSVDENVKLDRNNGTRYTLDLQGSCKEECGSDYIGGLTIKNKTLPRDTKHVSSVDERKRDSRLNYETIKDDKYTLNLKSIKVVVSDVEIIGNITDEEASKKNIMCIAASSENILETESMNYPIKRNPNNESSYQNDSNDHNQTVNSNMTYNLQSVETSESLQNTDYDRHYLDRKIEKENDDLDTTYDILENQDRNENNETSDTSLTNSEHIHAEPHTQESQDMKTINERTDGYQKTTLKLDSSLTDSQLNETKQVDRKTFVTNVEKSDDFPETTQNISESADRNDKNQSLESTVTTNAQIFHKSKSQGRQNFDKTQVKTKAEKADEDLNTNKDISQKEDCKKIVDSGIAHSSRSTETLQRQKNTLTEMKTKEEKTQSELDSSPEQLSVYLQTLQQQDNPKSEVKDQYKETIKYETTKTKRQLAIEDFMSKFGLDKVYPQKITLLDVMTIQSPAAYTLSQVPWMVLKNLMMMNSTCRDKMLQEFLERISSENLNEEKSNSSIENEDSWSDLSMFDTDIDDTQIKVNPLDLLVALFICSSQSLRNILVAKLFTCKLAIPLVIPSAINELTLTNSLLYSIVLDEKMDNNLVRQVLAINCNCHILSFVRFGRPSISKSKLINTILSDSTHETFFNENCPLGTTPKTISQGIIEAAWFLPSGELNNFEKITMFLNLRGNSKTEPKQLQLLSRLSSVIVILVDLDNLQDISTQEMLKELQNVVTGGVVLALDAYKYDNRTSREICQKYLKQIPVQNMKTKLCLLAVNKQNTSASEIKKNLHLQLASLLKKIDVEPLSTRIDAETDSDITRNKESDYLRKAKEKVENILECLPRDVIDVKGLVTPLQGKPWHEWSKSSKIVNRASKCTSLKERSTYQEKMKEQRQIQLTTIQNMHPFIEKTLDTFDEFSNNEDCFVLFTEWMKLMLNDRSRTVTSYCLAKYQSDCQRLESAKIENCEVNEAEVEVKKSRSNLNNAPFRFEHLIRECGQIFESVETCKGFVKDISNKIRILTTQLPKIAAKLLLLGQPMEILDGDTTHVPLMWVEAVLFHVKELIQDKKLLSISVVGLQSSGKSTLLNALFGLQFAVNAGRCTSGVFMQLVPVSMENSGFDYIVVFDTEGLRSQRHAGKDELRHDNMLATFVIGLGDITIVNVKGENTSEVKDILQIAVHAFLRLKLVNKSLNLKQSCLFIHQNVSDAGAISKMLEERQIFVQSLDEMAKAAADQEDVADIQSFNQIIDFDCEKNVSYFSDLWHGDPPMAPVNPGYCKRVGEVQNTILVNLAAKRKTYLTISDTITRIKDIWTGILKDDFVYGFRNNLERKASDDIDREYHAIVWELEKFKYKFVTSAEMGKLSQDCIDILDESVNDCLRTFSTELATEMNAQRERLVSFIETSNLTEVMNQWKEEKLRRMNLLSENLIVQTKTDMNKIKDEIKAKKIQTEERVKYEKKINELAQKLARDMQGVQPSIESIKQKFDQMWNIWLNELNFRDIKDSSSVADRIDAMLVEEFQSELGFMHSRKGYCEVRLEYLKGSILCDSIMEGHISVKKKLNADEPEEESFDEHRLQAVSITDKIFEKIDRKTKELSKLDVRFDNIYVREILNIISASFKDHNDHISNDYSFNLNSTYRAFIIEHVVRHLVNIFTDLDQQYESKHSPRGQMEQYKHTAWTLCTNLVEQKAEDMILIGFFKDAIIKIVTDHVSKLIPIDVADKVLVSFSQEKYTVMKTIMIELARNANFDGYMAFVKEPAAFTRNWLSDFLYKYIFHNKTDGVHHYGLLAKTRTTKLFETVSMAISETT
ncbi:interferon-induced very large GTPase 1-like [Mytilus californianus]|uniref:interferon-induced very large GTPase 1-like n=1 Tax=Mytilus californianus TaxID=6549 RepID=UPI0022479681|nr:interferon-induced very large GTPase 1-like [Mytilus californianus]XP_052076178.1 interferon-induced very large GTPase 1-like [Mytilus californianus]XP_052076179.1 interferon-induced very large GTPase 1-like [Mytilus californianus]